MFALIYNKTILYDRIKPGSLREKKLTKLYHHYMLWLSNFFLVTMIENAMMQNKQME